MNSHEIFTGNNQLDIVHVSKIRDRSFCRNLRDATLSRSGLAELKITSASELIRCSVRSPRLYSNSFRRFTQYTAASQIINNMKFDCLEEYPTKKRRMTDPTMIAIILGSSQGRLHLAILGLSFKLYFHCGAPPPQTPRNSRPSASLTNRFA